MQAIITAGGRVDGEFAATIGSPVKALAKIGARTMLETAVAAAMIAFFMSMTPKDLPPVGGSPSSTPFREGRSRNVPLTLRSLILAREFRL